MELSKVKQKAFILKQTIEIALKQFREETGYTPIVNIETKTQPTNDKTFVFQTATVTLTIQ